MTMAMGNDAAPGDGFSLTCAPSRGDCRTRTRPQLLAAVFVLFVAAAACAKTPRTTSGIECFDATASENSPETNAVFASRHCQGTGVTWAELIRVQLGRRGRIEPVLEPTPGWSGGVYTLNGSTRFSVDDEGDVARFCTNDPGLLAATRGDYRRVNTDQKLLRAAMSEASSLKMECSEADGSVPPLPQLSPVPKLPADQEGRTAAALARLKEKIRQNPVWCFPPKGEFDGAKGALRFSPDDHVIAVGTDGTEQGRGDVLWPRAGTGDDRIEIRLRSSGQGGFHPPLLHLDVGVDGNLGRDGVRADGVVVRDALIPGEGCLHSR